MKRFLLTITVLFPILIHADDGLDRTRIPHPVFEEKPEYVDLYWKAFELAWQHVKYQPGLPQPRYMDEACWDDTIWIWDSEFMALFCKYAPDVFPGLETLDNFYCTMLENSTSSLRIQHPDNPPFFPWVESEFYKFTGDKAHLDTLIRRKRFLQRYYRMFETLDAGTELPFDHVQVALKNKGIGYNWGGIQSGMDNTPRERGGKILWVDAIAQQALSARYTAILAKEIGDKETAHEFAREYRRLKRIINKYYWDREDGCYYDIKEDDRSFSKVLTPASFWPLLAGTASRHRARKMVGFALAPGKLGGEFPWKTVSADDPDYVPVHGKYWKGSIWLPTAYMGIKSLEGYGLFDIADGTAERILDQMSRTYSGYEPHTIWECYSPTAYRPADWKESSEVRPDFCGWSALGPISLFIENVIGIHEVNASAGTIRWDIHHTGEHGVRGLRFGGRTVDLLYRDGKVNVRTDGRMVLILNGRRYRLHEGEHTIRLSDPKKSFFSHLSPRDRRQA